MYPRSSPKCRCRCSHQTCPYSAFCIEYDELQSAFGKMHGFSTVDGFVEISESLAEMIKYVANEPSVGLFYIQEHTQKAVPNVLKLKKKVVEKSHETTLHTEDLEDSITMVRSMKECGFPIADEMIGDIKNSLLTLSTKQPKRGLVHWPASDFPTESTSFFAQDGSEKKGNYFSTVFKSAKEKARSLKWPQLDARGSIESTDGKPQPYPNPPLTVTSASTASDLPGMETDDLPLSSQVEDGSQHEQTDITELSDKLLSMSKKYDDFKANKEAQLEEWLEGTSNLDNNSSVDDAERL